MKNVSTKSQKIDASSKNIHTAPTSLLLCPYGRTKIFKIP